MKQPRLFAVFGSPVLHSKSPQIYNSVFEKLGSGDFYTRVRPSSAADLIRMIRTVPFAGASITAPFKEEVIPLLDELSAECHQIKAVNLILNTNGFLKGYNTDHIGVSNTLREAGFRIGGKTCLIIGAGGAARSVTYALHEHGGKISISNRTRSRAKMIADDFNCRVIDPEDMATAEHFVLVVSTLPPDALPPIIEKLSCDLLFDANYKPSLVSAFAKSKGIRVMNGERWLLHQAAEAFRLFSGLSRDIDWLKHGLSVRLEKDKMRVMFHEGESLEMILMERPDLMISSHGLTNPEKNRIVDEEIDKAFGG